jgi:hypothetical protein
MYQVHCLRYENLKAVQMWIVVLWDVTPCGHEDCYQPFWAMRSELHNRQ